MGSRTFPFVAAIAALGLAGAGSPASRTQDDFDLSALREDLAAGDLAEAYDTLREDLGALGDRLRPDRRVEATRALLSDPLGASALAADWTDDALAIARAERLDLGGLLRLGGELLELAETDDQREDPGSVDGLEARLDTAELLLEDALNELESAFAALDGVQREELRDASLAMLRRFTATVYVTSEPELSSAYRKLVREVDADALQRAAALCMPLFDAAFWKPALREARALDSIRGGVPGVTGSVLVDRETVLGRIIVGGRGPNVYASDVGAALIVDVGGNDVYAAECSAADLDRPFAIVVDLAGDDRHLAPDGGDDAYVGPAAALMGVGGVLDRRGDDVYEGGSLCHGAAFLGVGALVDERGDDRYSARAFAQGAGLFGTGLWVDRAGNDELDAAVMSQGFAGPAGFGLLVDVDGEDRRTATGVFPSSYGTEGEFQGMSQGAAVGWRRLEGAGAQVAGGFGMLVDGGGDDVSVVGEFGYGMGYYFGTGIVREAGGDDRVEASRYGIATGAHQAVGIVLDDDGDDTYVNTKTASIAGNWDCMVSVLVDARGNDTYRGGGITTGSSTIRSFSAFVDLEGKDRYESRVNPTSFGSCGHAFDVRNGSRCVALFADLGGDEDVYPKGELDPPPANDVTAVRRKSDTHEGATAESGVGLFVDR